MIGGAPNTSIVAAALADSHNPPSFPISTCWEEPTNWGIENLSKHGSQEGLGTANGMNINESA